METSNEQNRLDCGACELHMGDKTMQIAKGKIGYLSALRATLEDGPFRCPECQCEVILKQGDIYVHHFAHNPGEGCAIGGIDDENHGIGLGESELHRLAKREIYESLAVHKEVTNLKLERFLDSVRPDISFYWKGIPIAIELQVSAIRPDVINRRTIEYTRRGISLLWVSPYGEAGIRDRCGHTTRDWERIIHSMYFGTFYYWTEGEMLLPVHFESERTNESAHQFTLGMQIPHVRECISITSLASVSLPSKFTGETFYREMKLWCIPEVWSDKEGRYLAISEARTKTPLRFPDFRQTSPLEDPFHAEDAPSDFSLRGFVQETIPELRELASYFYEKYGSSDLKLIWVSVDEEPNETYFAPDWWQRFRHEYTESSSRRKDKLVDMLQKKLGDRSR
jgi:hypothetical protein